MITFSKETQGFNSTVENGFHIITEEGIEKGIFFRWPFKKYGVSFYHLDRTTPGQYYIECKKNIFKRLLEYIKGNYFVINKVIPQNMEDIDFGVLINKFISPIYFKREFKYLLCTNLDTIGNNGTISVIISKGYNDIDKECAGNCRKEKTKFHFTNSQKHVLISKNLYTYTYQHIIENFLLKQVLPLYKKNEYCEENCNKNNPPNPPISSLLREIKM